MFVKNYNERRMVDWNYWSNESDNIIWYRGFVQTLLANDGWYSSHI